MIVGRVEEGVLPGRIRGEALVGVKQHRRSVLSSFLFLNKNTWKKGTGGKREKRDRV